MLARSHTIIEITPTRLELAVVSGTSIQQRRTERFNPPPPGTDWAETLRARHTTLAGWVRELNLQGSATTVLFSSSTAVAALPACPAALGAPAAQRAAVLALAESAGYPIGDNPTSASILFTDARAVEKPGQGGAGTSQRMTHTLAVVETEANCTLLSQWVASCGLSPTRMIPATVPAIARLVAGCSKRAAPKDDDSTLHATLWFGEHESFFIVGDAAGIVLFRALSVGVENLVEGLLRPITPRNADGATGDPVTIDRAAARSLLERTGIPQPTDIVDERSGFTGASVLPLMNPVLQRFSVEVKQSLRFGLTDKQRAGVTLAVDGPGAALPRIDAALAQLCSVTVTPPPSQPPVNDRCSATTGNIHAVIHAPAQQVTLLPVSMQQARLKVRARRSLWTGVALSAAAIALYGGWLRVDLGAARSQADSLRASAEQAAASERAQHAASASAAAAIAANNYVARAVGASPDVALILALIGDTTDKRTSLESIDIRESEAGWVCRLSGVMQAGDDKAFADAVRAYTDNLAKSPLVSAVRLGAAARTKVNDADAHRFDLTLELVDIPYPTLAPAALTTVQPARQGGVQ
ncbi:MAG TPA: hypothetical protein VEB22_07040 [Phycisphaerales bacterium]|nr:hypothetical protein [Phycisphaerales bacterium]